MRLPLQVTFRGMNTSAALEEYIARRAEKLDTFASDISRCHVVVESNRRTGRDGVPDARPRRLRARAGPLS